MVVDTILAMNGGKATSRGRGTPVGVPGPGRAPRGGMGSAAARRAALRNQNDRRARNT